MNKNLITIKQNSKIALTKSKKLIHITNKILAHKDNAKGIKEFIKWLKVINIPDYYEIPLNENELRIMNYLRLDWGEHSNICITYLPNEICNLTNIKRLELCGNQLQYLPNNFGNLKKLKVLYLDYNNLIELPNSFSKLKLEELYIRINNFSIFPSELLSIKTLKILAITGINNKLPNEFIKLTNLEELYLGCNNLVQVPEVILKLKNLKFLSLRDNKLVSLPENIVNCKYLNSVILTGNENIKLSDNQVIWINQVRQRGGFINLDLNIAEEYNLITTTDSDDEIPF